MFGKLFAHESMGSSTAKVGLGAAFLAFLLSPDGAMYLSELIPQGFVPVLVALGAAAAGRATKA